MGEGGRRPGEGEDSDESLKDYLASLNKDLAIARERLVHYEAQCARQN